MVVAVRRGAAGHGNQVGLTFLVQLGRPAGTLPLLEGALQSLIQKALADGSSFPAMLVLTNVPSFRTRNEQFGDACSVSSRELHDRPPSVGLDTLVPWLKYTVPSAPIAA